MVDKAYKTQRALARIAGEREAREGLDAVASWVKDRRPAGHLFASVPRVFGGLSDCGRAVGCLTAILQESSLPTWWEPARTPGCASKGSRCGQWLLGGRSIDAAPLELGLRVPSAGLGSEVANRRPSLITSPKASDSGRALGVKGSWKDARPALAIPAYTDEEC